MSRTTALLMAMDGSAWVAGRNVPDPKDVVTLLETAAAERGELGSMLHTEHRQPPADGALMLYDRQASRWFRSKDGLRWDIDRHNPIVAANGVTLKCYYSVESEPRADGTRMHRRTYWLKDEGARPGGGGAARRGIALVQYRVLREDQTRRCTKRPRRSSAPSSAAPSSAPSPAPEPEFPWEASLDASLARLHVALQQLARAPPPSPGLAEAASPLQYLNDKMFGVQMCLF